MAWVLCAGIPCLGLAAPLTTARDIAANLTPKDADPLPVSLDATVTFQDPGLTIFLQDDTGVTFIRAGKDNPSVARGERLHIEGVTHNGLIIGGINPSRIERLSAGPPVSPRDVTPEDLASGRYHYHWVSISGVCRSVRSEDENRVTLRLNTGGRIAELRFDEASLDMGALVDAELRVNGLAAGDINDRRELVMPYVRVGSVADMQVIKAPPLEPFESAEVVPLASLQQASAGAHRVKIRGIALAGPTAGGLFLRDEDRSVFVQTPTADAKAGDVVEALGFPDMGIFSAQLSDAQYRVTGTEEPPEPLLATAKELSNGTDADLITVEARVLQRVDRESRTELLAQAGPVSITVACPEKGPSELQADAQIRVTGLSRVTSTKSDGYRAKPIACILWPRTMDDLVLLQHAPWWTSQRLALGLGGVALLALFGFVWAALLRRQVSRQLAVIEAKAQREAVAEERQRIAREFHDTMEQELAGLSLRLDAAATRVTDEKARALLEQQRKLLLRLQTETRDFVWDLRDTSGTDAPLDSAIGSLISHLQTTTTIPLRFECDGTPPRLPALMQHHILRITREAVHNAVKYSGAREITVALDCQPDLLLLEIADDGRGFELAAADAMDGHFGIRGMRERARKLGAEFRITSAPRDGTSVELSLPVLH